MIERHETARLLLSAALLVGLPGCGGPSEDPGASPPRPAVEVASARSLVLVTMDTTRADHLGPWGAAFASTPTLDALAAQGAVFERAYGVAPTTGPSHGSLLTGLDPADHGLRQNGLFSLDEEVPTLATRLREEGFATGAFVSAAVLSREAGLARGFDVYDDRMPAVERRGDLVDERRAEETVRVARAWLDELGDDRPFFLWVHLFDPHAPFVPPPPWSERFADRPYDGEIAYMDSQLGRLLEHPRIGDDVLVTVVADHGESLGEHGEDAHGLLLYDATLHVPWIVRGPGVAEGQRIAAPATHVDLLPTVLELLGSGAGSGAEGPGVSWAGALRGAESREAPFDRGVYAETFHPYYSYGWAPLRSLRRGALKLVEAPTPELYDLEEDPGETRNLYGERRGEARRLRRELLERVEVEGEAEESRRVEGSAARRLEALGYVARSAAGRDRERLDPKEVVELHRFVEAGRAALDAGDPARGLSQFERVLAEDPHNLIALEQSGLALAFLGRFDEAHARIERAIEDYPDVPELPLVQARVFLLEDRAEEALAATEAVLRDAPDSVGALTGAALAAHVLGRSEQAVGWAERALALDPDDAQARIVWSQTVGLPDGRAPRVVELLEPLTLTEARKEDVWRFLGLAWESLSRPDEAEAVYRRGLERLPDAGLLHARLGWLRLQQGDAVGAATRFRRAAALLDPVPAIVSLGLARVAVSSGDWGRVAALSRQAVEADPRMADAWVLLAAAEEELEQPAAALAAYERALAAVPEHPGALFNRALLLRRLQRFDEAIADLLRVLEGEPEHAAAHYELGVLYGALGDPARAREHLEKARSAGHPRPELIDELLARLGG